MISEVRVLMPSPKAILHVLMIAKSNLFLISFPLSFQVIVIDGKDIAMNDISNE